MATTNSAHGGAEPLVRLSALSAQLRSGLDEAMALKAEDKGSMAFLALQGSAMGLLELKEVNRAVWERVAEAKAGTQRLSGDMDVEALRLQNLQYEKNHLVRQIKHCRDFTADETPIALVDEATFAASAPAELRAADKDAAPHEYLMGRMNFELQQRIGLCEERDKVLAEKKALEEANVSKRAVIEGMGAQLRSLVRISLPLQTLLKQKTTLRWQEQRPLALLPPALRTLFQRALAYRDTTMAALEVSVVGDMEKAEKLLLGPAAAPTPRLRPAAAPSSMDSPSKGGKQKGEGGELASLNAPADAAGGADAAASADGADADGGRKRRKVDAEEDEEEEEEEWLRQHPLQVRVRLPLPGKDGAARKDDGGPGGGGDGDGDDALEEEGEAADSRAAQLELLFSCVPAQGLLAVSAAKQPETLLVHLLSGADAGTALPPPRPTDAVAPTAAQARETLLSLRPGAPFRWVQALGVATTSGTAAAAGGTDAPSAEELLRFGATADALVARMAARDALQQQLTQLAAGATSPAPGAAQPPRPLLSQLHGWAEETDAEAADEADEVAGAAAAAFAAAPKKAHGQRIFRAELRRGDVALGVRVAVAADYPRARPTAQLRWVAAPPTSGAAMPAALRALAQPAALMVAARHASEACDNNLLQMQSELNSPRESAGMVGEQGALCLGVMMHRLRMLLDVYVETEGEGGGSAAVCGTMCSRRVRGRDRRKPFIFDAPSGQFDQSR